MSRTGGAVAAALLALGLAAGCGNTTTPAPAAPVSAAAPAPAAPAPAAVVDDVELVVDGFHLLRPEPGDPAVQQAAAAQAVPASQLAQVHLVLRLRNTGDSPRSVADDVLQLGLGERVLEASTGDVFPLAPLAPGETQDTAVGFDVVLRGGTGPVALRWTHQGRTTDVPIGSARLAA